MNVDWLPRGLLSPYPKANVGRRFCAAMVDAIIVVWTFYSYWNGGIVPYLAVSAGYLLLRDAIRGQSIGKLAFGLVVISLETRRPATLSTSIRRNALLLLPVANVAALVLEVMLIVRDRQGQRLGDRLAQTQVVEGFDAKELVKEFQDWLLRLGDEAARAGGRRRREPLRNDRAA